MRKKKQGKEQKKNHTSIQSLNEARTGGQVALKGYSYQMLYSCYLLLTSGANDSFQLEGIEDIDHVIKSDNTKEITHYQIKYSKDKQDASFLVPVLKNYLEAYLIDDHRSFKLIYDFPVAKGYLKNIFDGNLDADTIEHWKQIVQKIQQDNIFWNWEGFNFDVFISRLSFHRMSKKDLATKVEQAIVQKYSINTDNLKLYANGLHVFCWGAMETAAHVCVSDIDKLVEQIRIDISNGSHNPAHSWIRRIEFDKSLSDTDAYYEGKKATPADIASDLPVKRPELERKIINTISEKKVTVIKAASGQGKTTLALKAIYALEGEYVPYQLLSCCNIENLGNTIDYFRSRVKLGEKVVILIDNLDKNFAFWNNLAQLLQEEISIHYRVVITARESDWFYYSGDISNIRSLGIVKPDLSMEEARAIYQKMKNSHKLHSSIKSWESSWAKVSDRKLLIEYVYLLTHGEMLADRINSQIKEINRIAGGRIRSEILRKVSFADYCGIKVTVESLLENIETQSDEDFEYILKSLENEFLIIVNKQGIIEGLHPVRSKHIVDALHQVCMIDDTAKAVLSIVDKEAVPVMFSSLYDFKFRNIDDFFEVALERIWDPVELKYSLNALKRLFSASVVNYHHSHIQLFDDAQCHGGLYIVALELCPYTSIRQFDIKPDTLKSFQEIIPDNENIRYLANLKESAIPYEVHNSILGDFLRILCNKASANGLNDYYDLNTLVDILKWVYTLDESLPIEDLIDLDIVWNARYEMSIDALVTFMFLCYCRNREQYDRFIESTLEELLTYLKQRTRTQKIYINDDGKAIHIEYISAIYGGNEAVNESIRRLILVCKAMPYFEAFRSDSIKPSNNYLKHYNIPDDAHKEMPRNKIIMMFNQDINTMWMNSIMSNYEYGSEAEWLNYWIKRRRLICNIQGTAHDCITDILSCKAIGKLGKKYDALHAQYEDLLAEDYGLPNSHDLFSEGAEFPQKNPDGKWQQYFTYMNNFINQFPSFLGRNKDSHNLLLFNLCSARDALDEVQSFFEKAYRKIWRVTDKEYQNLCKQEKELLDQIILDCKYYSVHQPSNDFKPAYITVWSNQQSSQELQLARDLLDELNARFDIIFPMSNHTNGVLRYYPVAIRQLTELTAEEAGELILRIMPFTASAFDYLELVPLDNSNNIINNCVLTISKTSLMKFKTAYENGDFDELNHIELSYPMEASREVIDCFDERIHIHMGEIVTLPVEELATNLWCYSKNREILTEACDRELLDEEMSIINKRITQNMAVLSRQINNDALETLEEIVSQVYNGATFNDDNYNTIIELPWMELRLNN